jgi:hypothetical protein
VRESGVTLIGVGFSEESKSRLLLIKEQSGSDQLILSPDEVSASGKDGDVTELCQTIAHLLASRYSIAYRTPLQDYRAERHIEVQVPKGSYRVLARRSK